jgi:hypothetical protein
MRYRKEVDEMLASSTELTSTTDLVDEPLRQPPSTAPSVEVSSTEVLITTQQVVFSTAAAVGARRENIGGRLVAIMRRMLETSTDGPRPRQEDYPRRYGFLEDARMGREMYRL